MSINVRPFRRGDRDQLTLLVNAHASAVMPGASASVNTVLNQLEREPSEFIVDPWVIDRLTLVAQQRERIVAAAYLHRYADDDCVNASLRNAGLIHWFVFWPDAEAAAELLMRACLATLDGWHVAMQGADGSLPVPGVYGIPEQWPHIQALFERVGFTHEGRIEIVHLANVAGLPTNGDSPIQGLIVQRSVGASGTRFSAVVRDDVVGFIEVESREEPGRTPLHAGLADIGNLCVMEGWRRRGLGRWLIAQAADWLRLGRFDRLLDYAWPEEEDRRAFLRAVGFREITRTRRGWRRQIHEVA